MISDCLANVLISSSCVSSSPSCYITCVFLCFRLLRGCHNIFDQLKRKKEKKKLIVYVNPCVFEPYVNDILFEKEKKKVSRSVTFDFSRPTSCHEIFFCVFFFTLYNLQKKKSETQKKIRQLSICLSTPMEIFKTTGNQHELQQNKIIIIIINNLNRSNSTMYADVFCTYVNQCTCITFVPVLLHTHY